ncbi:MAG: D-alanyl-D-alanine carboxypeptidase/D-alanyl-D-alanine-endopeptidase [Acidobacteria bacterium]|nr:MAG: D-alanyl-D-alanine carboxypeptidase/D-alanyl-D-alanine-endopeptidase [Acidobacteriota bacterium]
MTDQRISSRRLRNSLRLVTRIALATIVVAGTSVGVAGILRRPERSAVEFGDSSGPLISLARSSESVGAALSALTMRERAATAMNSRELSGLPACLDIRTEWGATIYSRGDSEARAIASNTKLFLTAAALLKLGPESRIKTSVVGNVGPDGRVPGGLWLVGGGDPYLSTLEFKAWEESQEVQRPTTSLAALADSVVAAGVKSVPQVIGDARVFDANAIVGTHSRDLIAQKVIPPISGLSVNRNIKDWATAPKNNPTFVDNPATAGAAELTRLLRERGVTIGGAPTSGPAPEGAKEIASVESAPMVQIVTEINEESDNFAAEMLLKYLGAASGGAGSTERGVEVMREAIQSLRVDMEGLTLSDGSGLSRNASKCRTLSDLLVAMLATPFAEDFEKSLAVAGVSGTLKKRFVGTPVEAKLKAKTGSLNDVAALSGYVQEDSDERLVFAFVLSVPKADRVRIGAEDAIARMLVDYPSDSGPPALGNSTGGGG